MQRVNASAPACARHRSARKRRDRAAPTPLKGRRAMIKDGLFAGKRILVTDGGTGLGKAMAEAFLGLGAEVFICGRRKQVCEATAAELMQRRGGKVHAFGVDIRDAAAVDAMVEEIFRTGPLTDLVNNAAGN